jgi:hypothetical protein
MPTTTSPPLLPIPRQEEAEKYTQPEIFVVPSAQQLIDIPYMSSRRNLKTIGDGTRKV